jgi:hypothetical protein
MSMKGKEAKTITDVCHAQKIAHNRYLPQYFLSIITFSFTIIIFSFIYTKKFLEDACT